MVLHCCSASARLQVLPVRKHVDSATYYKVRTIHSPTHSCSNSLNLNVVLDVTRALV